MADRQSENASAVASNAIAPAHGAASLSARLLTEPATTGDHAVIGSMFVVSSLLFALGAAVIGVLLGFEGIDADILGVFGSPDSLFQIWTLYRVALLLMVLAPLMLGLAMAAVPGQIGASSLAFPRAALGSFWLWLIGSVIVAVSALAGGGWGALSGTVAGGSATSADSEAISLTLLGTAMTITALLLGAIVVATTVISMRKPDMSLLDIPPFAWSMLVTAAIWLFTLPVAIANIVLVYTDLRGREPISFGVPEGGGIWLQLDWITEQPAVYAMAIPVLGIAAEMAGVAARDNSESADDLVAGGNAEASRFAVTRHLPSRRAVMASAIGLFGLLSIGGWSQDYFTSGKASDTAIPASTADYSYGPVYVAFGLASLLPVFAAAVGTVDSLRQGGLRSLIALSTTRLQGALAGLTLLAGAVVVGALRVIEPLELLWRSTASGVFNAVAAAGLAAGAAMIWHCSSRMLGSSAVEPLGWAAVGLTLTGGVLLAGADAIAGFLGRSDLPSPVAAIIMAPDALSSDSIGDAVGVLSVIAFIGSLILAAGLLSLLVGVILAVFQIRVSTPARRSTMATAL